jgi:glycosyltransferase involved in cell wall biosynthesis
MAKKVLHYMTHMRFGGIERLVIDLFVEQEKDIDLEPSLLVLIADGEYVASLRDFPERVHAINPKSTYRFNWSNLIKSYNSIRATEVFHMHTFHPYLALLAFLSGTRIFYTEHGNFGVGRKLTLGDKVNHFLRKLFFNTICERVICNSAYTLSYIRDRWKVRKEKSVTIHNGIALQPNHKIESKPIDAEFLDEKVDFVIGTVSRLAEFKRIDRLIDAFQVFYRSSPNSALVIVGEGVTRNQLEKRAGKLLNKSIFFTGYSSSTSQWYQRFDLCVFPSNYEPFGLVGVEAFRAQKPVLIFEDGGGLKEIVERHNESDICENQEAMLARMEHYANGGKVKTKKIESLIKYFSMSRMALDYKKKYI